MTMQRSMKFGDAWVADIDALPRTCVEAKLYDPRVLVELTVVAVKPA